ncbi:MAG: hypothetical protein RL432_2338 [Bacteroidota bacterium]|jgi:hypothetical protein
MFKIILIAFCSILSASSFGQVEYRDSILLKNGAGILCRVVEVTDEVVFFEQETTAIVLSASLTEVREIRWNVLASKIPSDTVQVSRNSPAYHQGKKDALTYYRKKHKTNYNTPYNPNNYRLNEPDYRAGYKDGAAEKRAAMHVFAASSFISVVILGVLALAAIVVSIVVVLINAIKGGGGFSVW